MGKSVVPFTLSSFSEMSFFIFFPPKIVNVHPLFCFQHCPFSDVSFSYLSCFIIVFYIVPFQVRIYSDVPFQSCHLFSCSFSELSFSIFVLVMIQRFSFQVCHYQCSFSEVSFPRCFVFSCLSIVVFLFRV